jgi:acetyl-CoA C-acetyltransferase
VLRRSELHRSPALATAGRVAFERAGVGPDDIEQVDLYACFPSVVQMSAEALGFDIERQLTVTGGLGLAGAPVGNAAGQSIAAMMPLIRMGTTGLVHANGGCATKQAIGIYSNRPPARFEMIDVQSSVDHAPRATAPDHEGTVAVEAATVAFDRSGPSHVIAAVTTSDGARAWARSSDPDTITAAITDGLAGLPARRTADGRLDV